jgi:hypothetical protein
MGPHNCQTDQAKRVTLPSAIDSVAWTRARASGNGLVGLEVSTHFVGNGADLKIELSDKSGKSHGSFAEKISGNRFWAEVKVPPNAKDELYANVKLPKHGLSTKSGPLIVLPFVQIENLKWGQKEARRGDLVTLTANVKGVPDGTEAAIDILEYDADGTHDFITSFTTLVKSGKIETLWEYEYHEDTDEIPTDDELKRVGNTYNSPEYFFTITINGAEFGRKQESGLLLFKDWIEINLVDATGIPMAGADYVVRLADGTEKKGKLDSDGRARVDVVPGEYWVHFPDYDP